MIPVLLLYSSLESAVLEVADKAGAEARVRALLPPGYPVGRNGPAGFRSVAAWLLASIATQRHLPGRRAFEGLVRDPSGKPRHPAFALSISHSDSLIVCAVTAGGEVGVDVEAAGRRRALPLSRILAGGERLPAGAAGDPLLRCWTAKEAVIKASGEGSLDEVAGVFLAGERARYLGREWCLSWPVIPGAVACLATDRAHDLECRFVPVAEVLGAT